MSYTRDKDHLMRGVGAIAAFDAGNVARARARAARARAMGRVDRRHARVTFGPNRALPVPMGAIKTTAIGVSRAPTINYTGLEVPPQQGPSRNPIQPGLTTIPVRPTSTPVPPPPPPPPRTSFPGVTGVNTLYPGQVPPSAPPTRGDIGTGTGTKPPPTPTIPPFPVPGSNSTDTSGTTAGGGGGGAWTWPDEPAVDVPGGSVPDVPIATGYSKTQIAVGVGIGLGVLYLLTRKH